ncbi:DUF1612 domain-containing protein [Mesorhizobium sp.]|uniref:DUF1612 domain-containing protein n=1 Tax=Mesorhizobium sp. TaxID=1871066 RepID=UPI00344DFB1C
MILIEAWSEIGVLQHAAWLHCSSLRCRDRSALLRAISSHCISPPKTFRGNAGKHGPRSDRLLALVDVVQEARAGLKEHDRLVLAKNQMEWRLRERRASSKLSDLSSSRWRVRSSRPA